jgi:hypothetical protein
MQRKLLHCEHRLTELPDVHFESKILLYQGSRCWDVLEDMSLDQNLIQDEAMFEYRSDISNQLENDIIERTVLSEKIAFRQNSRMTVFSPVWRSYDATCCSFQLQ